MATSGRRETPRERRRRGAAEVAAYRQRQRERGMVYYQRWTTPEAAAEMQRIHAAHTTATGGR